MGRDLRREVRRLKKKALEASEADANGKPKLTKLSKANVARLAESVVSRSTDVRLSSDPVAARRALQGRIWKAARRCVLCSKPSYVFALFEPKTEYYGDEARNRVAFYGLCVKCFEKEDVTEQVEDILDEAFRRKDAASEAKKEESQA